MKCQKEQVCDQLFADEGEVKKRDGYRVTEIIFHGKYMQYLFVGWGKL